MSQSIPTGARAGLTVAGAGLAGCEAALAAAADKLRRLSNPRQNCRTIILEQGQITHALEADRFVGFAPPPLPSFAPGFQAVQQGAVQEIALKTFQI